MHRIRRLLPFWFMLPASVAVTLFFVIPVFMTFVFSFTTMTSDTGILGNRYIVSEASLRTMGEQSLDPALVRQLGIEVFAFDEAGLAALRQSGLKTAVVKEIGERLSGTTYASEKALFVALKSLKNRPRLPASRHVTRINNTPQIPLNSKDYEKSIQAVVAFPGCHLADIL